MKNFGSQLGVKLSKNELKTITGGNVSENDGGVYCQVCADGQAYTEYCFLNYCGEFYDRELNNGEIDGYVCGYQSGGDMSSCPL